MKPIDVTPVGKPRMTQRDKWAKRPAVVRYYAYCDELRQKYKGELPERLQLVFLMPMPASWSTKKKAQMLGEPHQQKPDIDNLCKAVMDALAKDDSYIHTIHANKLWADKGQLLVGGIQDA